MKVLAPLLLFAAASASAEKIRQHGWCKMAIGFKPSEAPTKRACKGKGKLDDDGLTCALESADAIKKFVQSCKDDSMETCFAKKGDELPKGVPIPGCTFTKKCPGKDTCGCLESHTYRPIKCKKDGSGGKDEDNANDKDNDKGQGDGKDEGDGNGDGSDEGDDGKYVPYPGPDFFYPPPNDPIITSMGERLVAEGCDEYKIGPGPVWTEADRKSYACWQRNQTYSGEDADGWPGKKTWIALQVPWPKDSKN